MELKNWRFCSNEDNTISLHDCMIDHFEQYENGWWFIFDSGFNVTKDNALNQTKRHKSTGKAALFLKNGTYMEGAWNKNCTWQKSANSKPILLQEIPIQQDQFTKLSIEVLDFTWEPKKHLFTLFAIDNIGYCEFNFFCEELWFCWNNLSEDAWFQDWPKKIDN